MKKKRVAAILALTLGVFGTHRFYLGQRGRAILHLAVFFIAMVATFEEDGPWFIIPAIIGFIDAVLLGVMPKDEFDHKYNDRWQYPQKKRFNREHVPSYQPMEATDRNPYKSYGIEYYKDHDFQAAKSEFQKALGIHYEDPATHFNLACCYSQMHEPGKAIMHLQRAIEFGFNNFDRIHDHEGLYHLREEEIFEEFVENGYRLHSSQEQAQKFVDDSPPVEKEKKQSPEIPSMDLLEQLNQLGKLKEMGLLTEEEFNEQKRKILK